MKQRLLLASALIALIATSCSKSDGDTPQGEGDGYIRVKSSIVGTATKAIAAKDAALDDIFFMRVEDEAVDAEATVDFSAERENAFNGIRTAGNDGGVDFLPAQEYDKATDKTSYIFGFHVPKDMNPSFADGKLTWILDGKSDLLITDVWNAGRYSAPVTTGLIFRHAFARVEVIVQGEAGVNADGIAVNWGQITGISVESHPELELNLADRVQTSKGTLTDIAMTKGQTYEDAFEASAIPANGNTDILCGAMVAPKASADVKLKVTTKKGQQAEIVSTVDVTLDGNLTKGKIHVITLTFSAAEQSIAATSSTIEDWEAGQTGSGNVTQPPTVLEYGVAPFNETGTLGGSTDVSYNTLYGFGGTTNGAFRTTAELAYENEKPFKKFEIAKKNILNIGERWETAQGAAADGTDNLCVRTYGTGWRLPRLSELKLMYLNMTTLNTSGNGFELLFPTAYTSATEVNGTDFWNVQFDTGSEMSSLKSGYTASVRCIKELK